MVGLITMALSQCRMNDHGIRLICVDVFYMTGFTRINGDENEVKLTPPCAALMCVRERERDAESPRFMREAGQGTARI